MKALFFPILLALVGLLAGTGAGWFMRPAPPEPESAETTLAPVYTAPAQTETVRLPSQFLVPIIHDGRMRAMVVIGLALEVEAGREIALARHEARLRAAFLQTMFDHANLGGFDGVFTNGEVLHGLRRALRDIARAELGNGVHDVLITDLVRQES